MGRFPGQGGLGITAEAEFAVATRSFLL